MPGPYDCLLYVDTDEDIADLEAAVDRACESLFPGIDVEAPVYRNEVFDAEARKRVPYDFIESSRYYVELGTMKEVPQQIADFQSGTAVLVGILREGGRFVTASCGFEGLIVDKTGWNWSDDTPEPPGREVYR